MKNIPKSLTEAQKRLQKLSEKILLENYKLDDYIQIDLNESHLYWKINNH